VVVSVNTKPGAPAPKEAMSTAALRTGVPTTSASVSR
jgi:hypothetical protein